VSSRRQPVWPSAARPPLPPSPAALGSWGFFSSALAAALTVVTGGDPGEAIGLAGLGLSATVLLWAAARFGDGATYGR
jgi:hypothetical protein